MSPSNGDHRNSQLARALYALDLIAKAPRSAAELARALDVNRSTGLRLLQELEQLGYVRLDPESSQDGAAKRYAIIPERFSGHATAGSHVRWNEAIVPLLKEIRDEIGEATVLATPAAGSMVYVAFFDSVHSVGVRERLGTMRPMHASGIGKAWLSALDPDGLDAALGQIDYSQGTDRAPRGPIELRDRVEEARERGFAFDIDESVIGVTCVAAPARIEGVAVGAAAVSAPSSRMPPESIPLVGQKLVSALSVMHPSHVLLPPG